MTLPLTTVPAWTAFLGLPAAERESFLMAAYAYMTASGGTFLAEPHTEPTKALGRGTRTPAVPSNKASGTNAAATISDAARPMIPLIGGAALDLAPRTAFADPDFVRRWQPGAIIHAYVAGTPGAKSLLRPLELSAYSIGVDPNTSDLTTALKAGTTKDLSARMARHNRDAHASISKAAPARRVPGFSSWTPEALPVGALEPSPKSPVAVLGNALEIVLPASLTPEEFDRKLAGALASASLAGWAMSAAGRARCAERGVDPLSLVRGTPRADGTVSWCTELILIRVRRDALRFLRVCEQILVDHMAAEPAPDSIANVGRPPPIRSQGQARRLGSRGTV